MNGIVAWFARNSVAANLLMFIFFAGGLFGYSAMEREMFPVVKVSGASVSVAWTGASPRDIEDQIVTRIEEAVADINGLDRITSTSAEGFGTVNIRGRDLVSFVDDARARVEREVGQLDFDDFVAETSFNTGAGLQAGNPDINPEQAWVGEVAIEQRFWGKGALVLTWRHFELKDVVDSAPVFDGAGGVFDAPGNIGDGSKDEFAISGTLPLEKLGWKGAELRASATWRESKVTDPTTGRTREISGLRPLSWEAHFTHDLPQWRMNWGLDVYGASRESFYRVDQITDEKVKSYVELFVEYRPKPDLSVRAELSNLTERGLRNTRRSFAGPRSTGALSFIDDRDVQFGRMVYVRVRKTFGS